MVGRVLQVDVPPPGTDNAFRVLVERRACWWLRWLFRKPWTEEYSVFRDGTVYYCSLGLEPVSRREISKLFEMLGRYLITV